MFRTSFIHPLKSTAETEYVIPWFFRVYMEMDYLAYRWTTMVYLSYTTYINVDLARYEICHAKAGKSGIKSFISLHKCYNLTYQ